jgi:hypothetical protein
MRIKEIKWVKLFVVVALLIGIFSVAIAYPLPATAGKPTSVPVQLEPDGADVPGSNSTLQRNANGVSMTLHTSDLPVGHAVTNWWVFFNNPEYCNDDGCNANDLPPFEDPDDPADRRIKASVCFATGNVIGNSGKGNFGASIQVNDDENTPEGCLFGPGLQNAQGAEVHLVVRSHGPKDPNYMPAQINSLDGGCPGPNDVDPGTEPGPGECSDLQFAVHAP